MFELKGKVELRLENRNLFGEGEKFKFMAKAITQSRGSRSVTILLNEEFVAVDDIYSAVSSSVRSLWETLDASPSWYPIPHNLEAYGTVHNHTIRVDMSKTRLNITIEGDWEC